MDAVSVVPTVTSEDKTQLRCVLTELVYETIHLTVFCNPEVPCIVFLALVVVVACRCPVAGSKLLLPLLFGGLGRRPFLWWRAFGFLLSSSVSGRRVESAVVTRCCHTQGKGRRLVSQPRGIAASKAGQSEPLLMCFGPGLTF